MVVKEIGKDELGQPTVNGKPMLKFRIEKHLPDNKKSKKTLDAEKEKLDEQESGLPPGMEGFGFDVGEPDEPVGSTVGMREIERNFGTYASESKASRYLKPAGLSLLKRYGDGHESIQIYEKGNVLGWAVELSKVTDANTAKNIGQKIKRNLWGKRSPKLTSQQWHLHDLPMWVAYDEGAERIEAPKPPPPRQGTLFENWRKHLKEAYYGGIPDEPETPAGYGGAVDLAKVQRQLADKIDDLVKQGSLNPEDLSIETVRANQDIPWDRYEVIDDEDLEWILSRRTKRRRFYR